MTREEQYEARKAKRKTYEGTETGEKIDIFDRLVTAVERIADVLERQK